MFRTV